MAKVHMIILDEIDISPLLKAHQALKDSLGIAKTDLEKAGAIQYFEFCYELSWKTMRRILLTRGKELNSPKTVFREAALEKLIPTPEPWFTFLQKRDLTTQTYNESVALDIFNALPVFETEMATFINTLKTLK